MLEKPLKGGDKDLESFLHHIQTDLTGLFPDIRNHLIKDNQRDVEDWLNTVERQNQELIRWIEEQLHPQHYSELEETPLNKELVQHHFTERAEKYDRSSHWCTDTVLKERVLDILKPNDKQEMDVACGTGLVSAWFHKKVKRIVGVDITEAMYVQAKDRLDEFFVGPGEKSTFEDNSFDIIICRQGTQFMDDRASFVRCTV